MKQMILALVAIVTVASSTGCCCFDRLFCRPLWCGGCGSCGSSCGDDCGCEEDCGCGSGHGAMYGSHHGGGGCSSCGIASHHPRHTERNDGGQVAFDSGPPTGQVTYPYYTTRGPRDYLARNPRSIGP
jgi:hypothetical protein